MDTFNTMMATSNILCEKPEFSHVFMLGCDSYGFQLLIENLQVREIEMVFKNAQQIVSHFNSAPLQITSL
jgi:hypothetical protein